MTMEAEGYPIEGVMASRHSRNSNDEMKYTDNEMKKKGGRSNKGRKGGKSASQKSNEITSTPSRPRMQVTHS